MATLPVNHAAVIPEARARPMRIEEAPYPTPVAGEIVVRVAAIGINPIDWMLQEVGDIYFPWLQYPCVGGFDVAGTVVEVGPEPTGEFVKGDRVLALIEGFTPREGAFQEYAVANVHLSTKIPESLNFAQASVLPLAVATAAGALYEPGALELALPTIEIPPQAKNQVVLIWAGSSCVGSSAIQLAVASGYEVITTSSPHNFSFCKSLGASQVFDYKSPTIVSDIVTALRGKAVAGAVAVIPASLAVIYEILANDDVKGVKHVGSTAPLVNTPPPPEGVTVKFVFAGTIKDNHIGPAVYNDFLTKALKKGSFQAQPPALIVGNGLQTLQHALDRGKEGKMSAQKLVVSLDGLIP